MIKRIYLKLLKRYNPIRYAKKLGVEIGGGGVNSLVRILEVSRGLYQ